MSSAHSGSLIVRVINAKLIHDTDTFSKMDPYCKVKVGSQMQRTKVADGAGKFPNWGEAFTFKRTNEENITIEVWDYDGNSSDDLVGSTSVPFSKVAASGNLEEWVTISYEHRPAGEVRIAFTWVPEGHSAHGVPGGYPQHGYPPQGYPPQSGYPPHEYQPYPPQPGYPPQGYPPQGYPPQGYPPQGYPPQPGYPPQGYPPQPGYPPQGYPPQPGYPPQGYPPQPGYPPQGYPGYPPQGHH